MTQITSTYPPPAPPLWTTTPAGAGVAAPGYGLGFFLFLLVNAALFMRPTEIFQDVFYSQTYLVLILSCFVVSVPCVTRQLTPSALVAQPISVCILGLTAAIMLSHLTR